MADLKTHCRDCVQELGEEFRRVHEWLDELFRYVGPDHRGYRHNRQGIEEVRRRWGDRAAKAAEIHIKRDKEEGMSERSIIQRTRKREYLPNENEGI